jgi:SSS family solute:Na+ symporter
VGLVFALLVAGLLLSARLRPRPEAWTHDDAGAVDLTPWKGAKPAGAVLVVLVILIYLVFADFSVL